MTINLPAELTIWNQMTPAQRYAVMQIVGYHKSQVKYLRACLAHVRSNLSEIAGNSQGAA